MAELSVSRTAHATPGYSRNGKITFVDLAGSENLRQSQSTVRPSNCCHPAVSHMRRSCQGAVAVKETAQINKSLFTLGKVIATLGAGCPAPLCGCSRAHWGLNARARPRRRHLHRQEATLDLRSLP
jgi:hypothetical protein